MRFFIAKFKIQNKSLKFVQKIQKSTQNAENIHSVAMATNMAATLVQLVSGTRKPSVR